MSRDDWEKWFEGFKLHLRPWQIDALDKSKELSSALSDNNYWLAQQIAGRVISLEITPDKAADLWCEQSKMLWSRFKIASAIEAGALWAAYEVWKKYDQCHNPTIYFLPLLILLCSIPLLLCVIMIIDRDAEYLRVFQSKAGFCRPEKGNSGSATATAAVWVLLIFNTILLLWLFVAIPNPN